MGRRDRARALRPRDPESEARFDALAARLEGLRALDAAALDAARETLLAGGEANRDGLRWLLFAHAKLAGQAAWLLGRLGVHDATGADLEALLRCRLDELTWAATATALSRVAPERATQIAASTPTSKLGQWLARAHATPDTDPAPASEEAEVAGSASPPEPSPAPTPASAPLAPSPDADILTERDDWLFADRDRADLLRWALALEVFRFVRASRDGGGEDRLACAFALESAQTLGALEGGEHELFGERVHVTRESDRVVLELPTGAADFERALRIEQRLPLEQLEVLDPPADGPLCLSPTTRPDLF